MGRGARNLDLPGTLEATGKLASAPFGGFSARIARLTLVWQTRCSSAPRGARAHVGHSLTW
jgi:hypothetical protein